MTHHHKKRHHHKTKGDRKIKRHHKVILTIGFLLAILSMIAFVALQS
ncbi:MAG: hypothetical protein HN337_09705 [Deltaproteobacteria bacterium]|nr:hypothetical protein [Deltaproteobacteria bacterium]